MSPDDPMTKPRATTRRSENIPERERPEHRENFERNAGKGEKDAKHKNDPAMAVRQEGSLGDVSPRDETTR